jgi:TPR repeat protein
VPVNPEASMNGPMYPDPRSQDPGADYQFDTDDLLDSYYGTAPDEPDMPNFDAMPDTQKGPIDESLPGLEQQKPKTPAPAAPAGGQYAAFSPQSAPQPPNRAPTAASQFASAGFQFDLPNEAPPPQPQNNMGYGYDDPSYAQFPAPAGYSREGSVRSNGPPRPYRVNQPAVNQTDGLDPQQNPDALPQHPAPFRPGHDKPAPVRQYASPPSNSAAPPPAMKGPPADQPPGPVTHDELQRLQQMARNNPSDHKTQLLLAKKLVEASAVLVDGNRSDPKTKAKAREKYVMDGYKIVKKLVQSGYADAQFYLADCYGQGQLGLQADPKEAFSLYNSAAKAGHGQSAYRVAVCCEIGQEEGGGTKRDPFKAVQWYKRAAALGDTPAMYKMGMISIRGLLGQACSPREGISWLKRAAERADPENPHALHELGLMYSNAGGNDIVIRDEGYAAQLFHQAAELGYKSSQFRLGTAYENGLMSCPVDPRQSIIYYTHAASQGEHQSELALSGWYLTGADGILQQSDTEAYLWARKAATAGLSKAEYAMGYFTEVGIGVTANLDDAKRWYWRAAGELLFLCPW